MNQQYWHFIVLIPAHDEEQLLPRCLLSVLRAKRKLGNTATCDIVLVDDRSQDATFRIGRRMLAGHGTAVRRNFGFVGQARASAAQIGLERAAQPLERCWLANTDADCIVPDTWLLDQLALAEEGVEAVTGIVDVDSFAEHACEVEGRFRASYLTFPDGSHPHVHGANIGVRADAYLRAGGWAALETAEDHDLWNRLKRCGAKTVSHAALSVVTSGRITGRAPRGFAGALAAHNMLTSGVLA